jgi:hypothetical protein
MCVLRCLTRVTEAVVGPVESTMVGVVMGLPEDLTLHGLWDT